MLSIYHPYGCHLKVRTIGSVLKGLVNYVGSGSSVKDRMCQLRVAATLEMCCLKRDVDAYMAYINISKFTQR
jgi:hypothetical protein